MTRLGGTLSQRGGGNIGWKLIPGIYTWCSIQWAVIAKWKWIRSIARVFGRADDEAFPVSTVPGIEGGYGSKILAVTALAGNNIPGCHSDGGGDHAVL